jgi:ABC1 atypical kinase-like domain
MSPLFAAFGRYLSTRIDLLPHMVCEELAEIRDAGAPTPAEGVREVFSRELGCVPEAAFASFIFKPFDSRLFWQAHHASLGGRNVVARVIHPEIEEWIGDVDLLPLLQNTFLWRDGNPGGFDVAVEDFRRSLDAATSFTAELRSAPLFAQDAGEFDLLGGPGFLKHLCAAHVAVNEEAEGSLWSALDAPVRSDPERARTLCLVWLRQALQGRAFPVDPCLENIAFDSQGRVVFTAGPFATLADTTQASLWNYLIAVAADDADEACSHLAREIHRDGADPGDTELRRRFRQMVPFRDGPGCAVPSSSAEHMDHGRLSDRVLIHWRFAGERGRSGEERLTSFYRGLCVLARTAGRIAPGRDAFSEALRDLRLLTGLGQFKDALRPAHMAELMERYGTAFLRLPGEMDRMLTQAASGVLPMGVNQSPLRPAANENRWIPAASLLLALAGAAMLAHRLTALTSRGISQLTALLFLGLGFILLRWGFRLN